MKDLIIEPLSFLSGTMRFLGRIPAGIPDEFGPDAEGGEEERIVTLRTLIPQAKPGDFLVQVRGESMIDAGIRDGQYVLIRPTTRPRQGEICAVWVEAIGGTLKYVFHEGENIRLVPDNPAYETQIFPASEVTIQGVLVATIDVRTFPGK